jgi:hypothetical protein
MFIAFPRPEARMDFFVKMLLSGLQDIHTISSHSASVNEKGLSEYNIANLKDTTQYKNSFAWVALPVVDLPCRSPIGSTTHVKLHESRGRHEAEFVKRSCWVMMTL